MADKQFNLDFYARVETDLSSIKGAVSELKRQLSGLEIPKSASKGFERSLESLNAELQNFEAMAARGVTSLSDTKKMDASWRKISTIFSSLGIQIKELGDIDFFPKEVISNIEKANKALTSYQNKVEEIKKSQPYRDKANAKSQAETDRRSATADWQREKKKLENMERASTVNKTVWDQNRSKEYAEQTQELAELNSQIEQQNKALAEQRAIQQQLHSMKVITKDGQIRESHSAALNKAKAKQEELKVAKAAAQEQKELAEEQEKAAKKVLSSAKGQETKARKASGDDKDPKVVAAIEARTRAEQAYADAKAKSAEAAQNLEKIEKDSAATKTKVDELEGQQEAAKATATQIEGIEAQKRALESSRDAVKKAAKENEAFKASLDASDTALQNQRTKVETYKAAMDTAEQAVENFNRELQLIEFIGTASEWTQLAEIVRDFTGIDLSGFQGDITQITKVLNDYKNGQIKDAPELIKKLREAAGTAAPAVQNLGKVTREATEEAEEMKRVEGEMENLKNQVLEFFSVSNAIQIFKNAVRDAFDTVKELDAAMTETAVVTDFSIGDMWEKLPEYSAQATQLGTSIKSLYEATTLYYQQGLNSEQAMSVGIETMKMARIANMDAAAATEAMTAALRGFNMEINELSATRISDVYSELAAITASDTEQIATAMSKTASIAASANMEFETTAALLAQIIETTQEAPETAGTAMKTIIARFSEVKQLKEKGLFSGEDSEGELIDVNKIQEALRTVGISMDEFFAGTEGLDSILLELASKWNTLDFETQHYIATMAAGSRQQSRFMAMMSNYERTMELVAAANDSAGASQKQFDKTLESLDAKLQKLQNAWDTFVMGLANNELIKTGVDILTKLLETINNLTDDLGGVIGGIAKLGVAVAALKTGKSIFDKIFDVKPLEQNVGKINNLSSLVGNGINRLSQATENGLTSSIKKATMSMQGFSTALTLGGVACGAFAQYLRSMGLDEAAKGFEIFGGILITVGAGFSFVASTAAAAGVSVGALLTKLGAILVTILPWILAIGAAIAVVALALKKIYDNSAAGKLKAAQKATKAAAEAAAEAAEEYNNLNTAISSITDKTDALNELTKGTQEWRDAVVSLNSEILSLVESYPELASFLSNEGGVLKIDYEKTAVNKQGQEYTAQDVLDSYMRKQTETQQIYNQRQIREKEAETNYQYTKTMKDFSESLTSIKIEDGEFNKVADSEVRKIVDQLAIEIAKGNIKTDESSIQDWLNSQNVQTQNFEEFDYSVFKTYGDYLLSQQSAIDGLTDATIAAHMAMLKLSNVSNEATEAVTNFDENILRDAYNAQLEDAKTRTLTQKDEQAYAEYMGYTYETRSGGSKNGMVPEFEYVALVDKNGKTITQDKNFDQEVRDFVINKATNEDFSAVLQKMAEHYDSADEKERELFSEVFANGLDALSSQTLSKYGTYEDGQFGFNEGSKDAFAEAMNFESFDEMTKIIEIGEAQLIAQLEEIFAIGGIEFAKVRKNLIKNMSKYSSIGEKSYKENANILAGLEEKFGEQIRFTLENVINSLELTGDEPLTSAGLDYFKKVAQIGTQEDIDNLSKLIESIDWTDPINGAYKLREAISKGSEITRGFAETILSIDDGFLSGASQFESFFNSDIYKDMGEDLRKLLETQGEITETDVRSLASEYSYLNKLLKNTSTTAEGLAAILTSIEEGELTFEGVTDAVIAAIGSMDTLGEATSEVIAKLEELEFGDDLGKVQDFYSDWGEKLTEIQQEGGYGGPELTNFLDYVYGSEWDKGLVGDEAIIAKENELIERYQKTLGKDMYYAWESAAKGLNVFGQEIDESVLAKLDAAQIKLDYINGEVVFEILDDNMTFDQVTENLQQVFGGSKQLWDDLMTYFSYRSPELQRTWQLADYNQMGQRIAKDETNIVEGKKFITSQEVQTIVAEASIKYDDKDIKTIESELTKQLGQNEVEILTVLDTGDIAVQANDLLTQLNTIFGGTDAFANLFASMENGIKTLDFTALIQAVNNLPISQELANQISNSIAQGVANAGGQITYEIEGETRTLDLNLMADGTNFIDAVNAEIAAAEEAAKQAELDNTAMVTVDQAAWNASVDEAKSYIGSVLSGLSYPVKAYVYEVDASAVTNSSSKAGSGSSSSSGYTLADEMGYKKKAGGDPKVSGRYDSLVGEEGPELIESGDEAYLSGVGGPQITTLHQGDVVHTAEETKEIFKRKGIPIPAYRGGTLKPTTISGGSGGTSKDDNEETWENPFDKLYNLVRKIDEELHQRERIERRYEKLLESINTSANKIIAVSREELAQLERERMLQEQLISGRKYQINQYQSENSDLTKYANVVQNDRGEDILRINWDLIDSVTNTDEGQRIEDYVSQLEEWFDELEEAEDALWDIEDAVEEIKERGKEEYFNLEDAIKEAFVQSYQDEIDKLSQINDSINDTNSSLLDAIQKSIDKQRQDRDNQRTEDDLAEKQRRLLYLQQDTSGANAMEILKLQEEIAQGQEDYTDTLIDQKISELQEQNDEAAKQRDQQITIAQAQLDHYIETGRIWQEVYGLMDDGLDKDNGLVRGSRLEEILKSAEGYEGMSEIAKMEWMNDTNNMIAQALAYLEIGRQLEDIGTQSGSQIEFTTSDGRVLTGTVNDDGSVTASDGQTYNNVFQGYDGKYYAGENIADVEEPVVEEATNNQSGSSGSGSSKSNPYGKASDQGNYYYNLKRKATWGGDSVRAIQWALKDMGYDPGDIDGTYGYYTWNAIMKFQKDEGIAADGDYGSQTREKMRLRGYKTGGLADFTGPAWLDGTKARPELVLNQRDTQNFIQLKDILASLMAGSSHISTENNGDITYDIDINVESIGSDYDVEQVANKVKSLINSDARYRNNNTISLMR